MNWKIVSNENLSATPIYSVDDPKKLLGYEGWKVLAIDFARKNDRSSLSLASQYPMRSALSGGTTYSWQDITAEAHCSSHRKFHSNSPVATSCDCGIHSFSSLDELRTQYKLPFDSHRYAPVRLVHSGKMFKGSVGVKSYGATLTGIYLPSFTVSPVGGSNDRNINIPILSDMYGLPLLKETDDPSSYPSSAQFLKQRYGL